MKLNGNPERERDPRLFAIPDIHGHAKGEHKLYAEERPIPLSARMLFLWFFHACRRGYPRFLMVADHMNYLTFEDPAAVNLVRRALKLAQAGDLHGAAETAGVEIGHAAVVSEGLRRGMRYSIGAEVDNDPRSRPDAQNIVDAMRPDGMIRSVHFLPITHPVHGENWSWPFDNPEFREFYDVVGSEKTWELYMTTLLDAIERLPGQIIGHFYVPAIFGQWPDDATLEKYEDQFVEACEKFGKAIEFNTRFLYRDHPDEEKARYVAAYTRLLKKAKARNVGIAVGSDAHSPKDQGNAFDIVLAVLDECEINEIVFPIAGRLARVALRVERKPEPEPEPPPPAPAPAAAVAVADVAKPVRKPRPRPSRAAAVPSESAAPAVPESATPAPPVQAPTAETPAAEAPAVTAEPAVAEEAATAPEPAPAKPTPGKAKAASAKATAEKATTAKAVPAKPTAKAALTKPTLKKSPAKKASTANAPAKKTAAKKAPAKAATKKTPAKTTAAKKVASPKKPAAKAPVKHAPAKKAGAKKTTAKRR